MKCFNIRNNIGKAKYVVSFFDGVKTHRDGSDFFDVVIFKNKVKLNNFTTGLRNSGYVETC